MKPSFEELISMTRPVVLMRFIEEIVMDPDLGLTKDQVIKLLDKLDAAFNSSLKPKEEKKYPDIYQGFKTKDLLETFENCLTVTDLPFNKIAAMENFLAEYLNKNLPDDTAPLQSDQVQRKDPEIEIDFSGIHRDAETPSEDMELARIAQNMTPEISQDLHLPDLFKGYKTSELLQVWAEIQSPPGTKAPKEKILALRDLLRKYHLGLHSLYPLET